MTELHEIFTYNSYKERRNQGKQSEFHGGEYEQTNRADERKREANKINQIKIELLNMPVLALEIPVSRHAEKPDRLDTQISFLDII